MQWSGSKDSFGEEILFAEHELHTRPQFTDEGLEQLFDQFPSEEIGLWTFHEHSDEYRPPVRGTAVGVKSADIIEAVKKGHIWINLRDCNRHIASMQDLADEIFGSISGHFGQKTMKEDVGLLISSPNVTVNYHLDIPFVCLVHLRGEKRIWLYPDDEMHAPSEHIQNVILKLSEEELPYQSSYEAQAQAFDLTPGMALTWPQSAPHRIQNANSMNVSLSCEYMTLPGLIKTNAMYTNGLMRTKLGLNPPRARDLNASTYAKMAAARLLKVMTPPKKETKITPPSFKIDLATETCTAPL